MLSEKTQKYFENFEKQVKEIYILAEKARKKGLDPVEKVEVPLAMTMAAKVVSLIATIYPQIADCGIDKRILELEDKYGKLDVTIVFKIAEEVAKQKFCKFSSLLEAMDAGIRVGFAYITLGVVSSPIEGFTGLKLRKTMGGKEYIDASFSGPIRSAGTTASCVVLILIDYLREMFGFAKYDPTEEEIKRFVAELTDFHERITNLQYMPTEEEMLFIAKNMPIQISGDASEKLEVSNYKNLERVDTDYLRSGFCLVLAEGLAQKAAKGFRLLNQAKENGVISTGFDFLEEYIKLHEKRNIGGAEGPPTYIKDLVAGRPVYGHPGRSGGFRFRYGRGRNSGFSASSINPATMGITDDFIANGTQLKIEKPTKGMVVTSCDVIEGPIVKLYNGSVRKLKTKEEAKKLYPEVEEIIYLGDLLFPFSDVVNRNAWLISPGYVEEWWIKELEKKDADFSKEIDCYFVDFEKAIEISNKYKIPLHPKYLYFWTQISKQEFKGLMDWLKYARLNEKIIFPYTKLDKEKFEIGKRALEILGVEHEVTLENVVLSVRDSKSFLVNLGFDIKILEGDNLMKDFFDESKFDFNEDVLKIVNSLSNFIIKDKAGEFIGSRMGRPEKAKIRKLAGSPNVLFPVGNEGGRLRSVQTACGVGGVKSSFPFLYCKKCEKETIYNLCEICGSKTIKKFYFPNSKTISFKEKIDGEEKKGMPYLFKKLDISYYFNDAVRKLGLRGDEIPVLVKGVRGVSSEGKSVENLAKGLLRAKYNLQVNKDGTVRFDATEIPLISFKPKEISVGIEKLKELGYTHDVCGKELVNDNQILNLMPHDILLPSSPESPDERGDDVFFKISKFIDEELERFYGMKRFYNAKSREDLVGHFGVCMAPHNCAGVVCRIIGFSNTLGLMASPYMHAAIRRDCDGDEMAVMLLTDVLLNFSRKFLPSHRGGTQDAPLVLNARINAGEVDDQILDFEFVDGGYPLELYEMAEKKKHSGEIKSIKTCKQILKENKDPFIGMGFTHNTDNFNDGVTCSSYKLLATMQEKVEHQMNLVEKIRAVDTSDTARLIIERHFIRDMRGNLRKFSQQGFRCVACNESFRRPPLSGICPVCKGKIIFTIHEGGIKKYLEPALLLAKKYELSSYIQQNLELIKNAIDSIFGKELEKQTGLGDWGVG
jgi:DNA polymerase II large subunit